eukprot:jgi/Mesvir1/18828/Mv11429-RA.1
MTWSAVVRHGCPCGRLVPLCDIYVCAHCDKIACQLCVVKEIESTFCPNCLEVAREGVSAERGRCCRCADCPVCFSTLSIYTRSEAAGAGQGSQDSSPSGQPYVYFRCENCRWQSAEVGLVAPDAAALADELLRRERAHLGMHPDAGVRVAPSTSDRSPLPSSGGTPGYSPLVLPQGLSPYTAASGLSPFASTPSRLPPPAPWFTQRAMALAERLQSGGGGGDGGGGEAGEHLEVDALAFPLGRGGRRGGGGGRDPLPALQGARLFPGSPGEGGSPGGRGARGGDGKPGGGEGGATPMWGGGSGLGSGDDDKDASGAVTDASDGVGAAVGHGEGYKSTGEPDTDLQQRLRNPCSQPYERRMLLPCRKPLRPKVAKRCEGCLRYLVKPDALPGSARFKLRDQSVAIKVLPTVTLHPRSAIHPGGTRSILVLILRNPLDREVEMILAQDTRGTGWGRLCTKGGGDGRPAMAELACGVSAEGHTFRLGAYSQVDDTDDDVQRAYRELESSLAAINLDDGYSEDLAVAAETKTSAGLEGDVDAGRAIQDVTQRPSHSDEGGSEADSKRVEPEKADGSGQGETPLEERSSLEAGAARGNRGGASVRMLFSKGNVLVLAVPLRHRDCLASLQWPFSLTLKFSAAAKSSVQKVLACKVVLECKGLAT